MNQFSFVERCYRLLKSYEGRWPEDMIRTESQLIDDLSITMFGETCRGLFDNDSATTM